MFDPTGPYPRNRKVTVTYGEISFILQALKRVREEYAGKFPEDGFSSYVAILDKIITKFEDEDGMVENRDSFVNGRDNVRGES